MKVLVLNDSPLLEKVLDLFKTEAKFLKQRLVISRPGQKFWTKPELHITSSNTDDLWVLSSFCVLGLKKIQALLQLSLHTNFNIICLESNYKILSLLSRLGLNDSNQKKSKPADINAIINAIEGSILDENTPIDDIFEGWQKFIIEGNKFFYVLFESIFKQQSDIIEFSENLFGKKRKKLLNQYKTNISFNRLGRLDPPFRLVSSSVWLEKLLNEHFYKINPQASYLDYHLSSPEIKVVSFSDIKDYFKNNKLYNKLELLFERVLKLEPELSKYDLILKDDTDEQKYQSFQYIKLSPFEILGLLENNISKLKAKVKLSKILKQEYDVLQEKSFLLGKLKTILAKSQNFYDQDLVYEEADSLLIVSYDMGLVQNINQAKLKTQKFLWLELNRLSSLDDLVSIDLDKYLTYSKTSIVLTQKSCSSKIGRWILNAEVELSKAKPLEVVESSETKIVNTENTILKKLIYDFWHPVFWQITKDYVDDNHKIFKKNIVEKLEKTKLDNLKDALEDKVFYLSINPDFISRVRLFNKNIADSDLYILDKTSNLKQLWSNLKTKIAGYSTIICQLDASLETEIYSFLNSQKSVSVIVLWEGLLDLDLISKYDKPNWEFFYYSKSSIKNNNLYEILS